MLATSPVMLLFPTSLFLVPITVALGVVYVTAARLQASRLRTGIRLGVLMCTCIAPALTRGPGPAQLMLGLVGGYLGIRMVALSRQGKALPQTPGKSATRVVLELIVPDDLFVPTSLARPAPLLALALAIACIAACLLMLIGGNDWRLWQTSLAGRFLDDQLVLLEIAVGAAGVHYLVIACAGMCGRSVVGFQNQPLLSASLAEFWARRWNRMVQGNLKRGFFQPQVRSGRPELGVLAAFTASGVLHVMAVIGAGPPSLIALPSLSVMGFFLLHAGLVLVEKRLGWDRIPQRPWSLLAARVRTIVVFIALSPLLIDPFACVTHVHGRAF
jgi:Membrane bound O-acyl transferase family